MARQPNRCPHCHEIAASVACVKCNRDMCEHCLSFHWAFGKVCGLCFDEINAKEREDEEERN